MCWYIVYVLIDQQCDCSWFRWERCSNRNRYVRTGKPIFRKKFFFKLKNYFWIKKTEKVFRFLGRILGFKPIGSIDLGDEGKPTSEDDPVISMNNIAGEKYSSNEKLVEAVFEIQKTLKKMYSRFEADEIDEEKEIKWKYAAIVMDRLFLYLFIFLNIVIFVSTVMSIPNFYKMT